MRTSFRVPPPPRLHPVASYAVALCLPLGALAVQHALRPWVEHIPFVLFFLVVAIAGSVGGLVPGVLSVAVSAASGWLFLSRSANVERAAGALVGAIVFAPVGLAIALLGALVREGFHERESAARELSDAVRARDEFISTASHELKTPLTGLSLGIQRLSRSELRTHSKADPTVARALSSISRQTARLNVLVNNLLDVSRISAGRIHLEIQDVDLVDVVRGVAARFDEELSRSRSTLTLSVHGPAVGRWDRLRLEQVLTNLLSNAVKYGSGRPIEVSVALQGGTAVLRVADQGIGIRTEDQQRIFERFERAVDDNASGGIGVGLWIVREIVAALAGAVHVESAPGRGTKFTVLLPARTGGVMHQALLRRRREMTYPGVGAPGAPAARLATAPPSEDARLLPQEGPGVTHYVVDVEGKVRPLCGEWGGSKDWTKVRSAVSCPGCLERLNKEKAPSPEEAPPKDQTSPRR